MKQVQKLSDKASEDFPDTWYEIATETHFWFEWRFRAFLQQMIDIEIPMVENFRALEIGCGHGLVRRQLEKRCNWQIDGCDSNEDVLRENQLSTGGETFFYDIHDRAQSLKKKYDVVVLFDVLEHIEDTGSFIQSVLFHLKDGGWLLVNVPALDRMRSQYDQAVGHLRRYNKKMLSQDLLSPSLKIIDMRYWALSLVPILFLRKLFSFGTLQDEAIIKKGLDPPNELIHMFLKNIMRLETHLLRKPLIGSSLLAAAKKLPR